MTTIEYEDFEDKLRIVRLAGRLDVAGTEVISAKFSGLSTGQSRRVVMDISAVTFLSSIGLRELVTNAMALDQRGGKSVIYLGENAEVANILDTAGIGALIGLFRDVELAAESARN